MKRAILIIAFVLTLLTTTFFFKEQLLLVGCRLFLSHYLNYDSVEWKEESLVVIKPRPKEILENGAWEAKELRLQPNFNHGIAFDATIVEPFIAISDLSSFIANQSISQSSWITSHLHLTFVEGKIALSPPELPPLILNAEGEWANCNPLSGIFVITLKAEEERNRLFIDVRPEKHKTVIHFSLQSLDCPAVAQVISCISPESMQHWVIGNGALDGNWTATFPSNGPASFIGEGVLTDLRFAHIPSGAQGLLEKASLSFSSASEGQLELLKPAHIELQGSPLAPCHFKNVIGGAFFEGERSTLQLDGELQYENSSCHLKVSGQTYQDPSCQAALDLYWESANDKALSSSSHFALYDSAEGKQRLELTLQHIREEQALVLQAIASDLFPSCKQFQMHSGELSTTIHATIDQQQIQEIQVQEFSLNNAEFSLTPYFKKSQIAHAAGQCTAVLNDQQFFTLKEGSLNIEGSLVLAQESGEEVHELKDGRGKLLIKNGTLEEGSLSFGYKGLAAALTINQASDNHQIEIILSGELIAAAPLLPAQLRSAVEQHFKEDKLLLRTALLKKNGLIEVSGQCVLESPSQKKDLIPFSCQILKKHAPEVVAKLHGSEKSMILDSLERPGNAWPGRADGGLPKRAGEEARSQEWPKGRFYAPKSFAIASPENDLSKTVLAPLFDLLIDLPSDKSYSLSLENGRIYGEALNLERYAALWNIFPPSFDVKGRVNVKGYFDQNGMTLYYEARDVSLESPGLLMKMALIGDLAPDVSQERQAFLYQDFKEVRQKGQIPICDATYLEKNHDLQFHHFSAMGKLEDSVIELMQAKAECEGVQFEGAAKIDNGDPTKTELLIHATRFEGSFSSMQKLCSHLCDLPFWKLSTEGKVVASENGLELHFHFYPEKTDFTAKVHATLAEGSWNDSQHNIALSNCNFDFNYDHEAGSLELSEIQGELLLPSNSLPFSLHSKQVRFTDFPDFNIEFEIAGMAEDKEVFALIGKSVSSEGAQKKLLLDAFKSHIGSTQVSIEKCHFTSWDHLLSLQSQLRLDAKDLYADLKLCAQLGLFPEMTNFIEPFAGNDIRGPLALSLIFDEEENAWNIDIEGSHIVVQEKTIERLRVQRLFY